MACNTLLKYAKEKYFFYFFQFMRICLISYKITLNLWRSESYSWGNSKHAINMSQAEMLAGWDVQRSFSLFCYWIPFGCQAINYDILSLAVQLILSPSNSWFIHLRSLQVPREFPAGDNVKSLNKGRYITPNKK